MWTLAACAGMEMLKCSWATWFSGYSRIGLSTTKHQVLSVRSRHGSSIWLGAGTGCTELGHTAEPGCHKFTISCASKKHCSTACLVQCCCVAPTVVLFRLGYGGMAQSSCPGADLLLGCRQDSGEGEV